MFRSAMCRTPRAIHILRNPRTRLYATQQTTAPSSQSRIERFNRRLPKFLHKYTSALGKAPVTHITSFLLLHELTAVLPLFGLAGYFHYTHWLPSWFAEGAFVLSGVERFGRYFKKKGWIRSDEAAEAEREVQEIQHDQEQSDQSTNEVQLRKVDRAWKISEGGVRLVVEFATAYAIVKALLVPRIMFSVWATPWFAKRTVVPIMGVFKKIFSRGKHKNITKRGADTETVQAGVVSKSYNGKGS